MKRVVAIILGGGEGKRLFPLTANRSKPAVPFARYRLIDVPISNALNSNIRKIFIISQFLSFSLHQHLIKTYHLDSFSSGFIEVLAPEQKPLKNVWFQGTADSVRQNLEYLLKTSADYFLILAGDQLYNMDFQPFIQHAIKENADLTIAALPIVAEDTKRMGIFKVDEAGTILEFQEKPQDLQSVSCFQLSPEKFRRLGLQPDPACKYLGSMGIYVFKRQSLIDLLQQDTREDFGKHLIPTQVQKGGVCVYPFGGYWEDIGTIDSYFRASLELAENKPAFDYYNELRPIYTAQNYLPSPKIIQARIENAIICEGSIIESSHINRCMLGQRTIVKKGVLLKDAVIMGNDFYVPPLHQKRRFPSPLCIDEGSIIQGAILDKNVSIGKNVQLINKDSLQHYDGPGVFIRDGIIVVAEGASIPDGFIL